MYVTPEQIQAAQKANVEALLAVANAQFAAIEKAIAYSKSVYEVATEANSEFSRVAERRVAEWNENFVSLLDKVSKNATAGSDVAVAAVKSMLAAANVAAATETVKGLAKSKKVA